MKQNGRIQKQIIAMMTNLVDGKVLSKNANQMNDEEKVVDYENLSEEAKEELSNGKEEGVDEECHIPD